MPLPEGDYFPLSSAFFDASMIVSRSLSSEIGIITPLVCPLKIPRAAANGGHTIMKSRVLAHLKLKPEAEGGRHATTQRHGRMARTTNSGY
jgi:hypothetical protein